MRKKHFNETHGMRRAGKMHPLYNAYINMRKRCLKSWHPLYPLYGGRGICICPQWLTFAGFLRDMQPTWKRGLSMDRIDSNGNYEPSNCRWTTCKVQAVNRRSTRFVMVHGVLLTRRQAAKKLGIAELTLRNRLLNVPIVCGYQTLDVV
jgi:hypothetical protein